MNSTQPTNPYADNEASVIQQTPDNNTLAIASLVLGILSLFFYMITAIPGIITGHMARSRIKNNPHQYSGKGMALAGLIISYIMLFLSLAVIVSMVYLVKNNPEIKDAFFQGMQQGLQNKP